MLVAGSAAMLVGLVDALIHRFLLPAISPLVRADPVPVITAVVMAVGFLGAGTIMRRSDGEHVEGLTTAAAMLFSAAVGSAVGLRLFVLAIGATTPRAHHAARAPAASRRSSCAGRPLRLPAGSPGRP